MRLLVSVRNVEEALAAAAAGVDFIDLKEPSAGALGHCRRPPSKPSSRRCSTHRAGARSARRSATAPARPRCWSAWPRPPPAVSTT
nr:(5-formylfuran-3-yl)methyl phosphate synthase [Methylibium sp. T29-B]